MSYYEIIKNRFSTRKFKDLCVEKEKIDKILEAGRLAPTACNNQPQRIKILIEQKELKKVDICTPCRFDAPLVLLVCYDSNVSWKRSFDKADSGEIDVSIAVTQMMLAAEDLKLSSCWVMYFDPEKTRKEFSIPENLVPVAFLPIGYASDDAAPSESHFKRNKIEDFLF